MSIIQGIEYLQLINIQSENLRSEVADEDTTAYKIQTFSKSANNHP